MAARIPVEQTAHLPKPLLVWDGECGFCAFWVDRWKNLTGRQVAYAPYQEVTDDFPAIPTEEFRKAAYLIEPDGTIYRGLGAAYRTFTYGKRWGFLYRCYSRSRLFRKTSDALYQWIADHRPLLYNWSKWLLGNS